MSEVADTLQLLKGVARFLKEDVRGAVDDPALRFRALIAANLVRLAMAEVSAQRPPLPRDASPEDLLAHLRAELAVVNPSFDTRDDIETIVGQD